LTSRAVTQARQFNARTATPYRAVSLEPSNGRHLVRLEEGHEIAARAVLLATGAQYRRLPAEKLSEFEGLSVFSAAGPPEARLCGASRLAVVGGGNSAGQAAVWLSRGGALVTLLHRRGDLRETMSDYLVLELEHAGVAVRDRAEIAGAARRGRQPRSGHAEEWRAAAVLVPLPLPRCAPVHRVARRRSQRDNKGFVLTGSAADTEDLLETSVPGIFAAGDVRSGSTKRCATAVGEGAMAVQFVHGRLAGLAHAQR
jgi:thioredoxin reductase (NADPH)